MSKIILSTNSLDLEIDSKRIFKSINLNVYKNKINTILGPSGCGKTSLLNSLALLNRNKKNFYLSGSINCCNETIDLSKENSSYSKRFGFVFQEALCFPVSIEKNLSIALLEHSIVDRRNLNSKIEELLSMVGLWDEVKDKLNQPANKLSGGQKQRLCIARAMSIDPEILLLDEPTSNLDPLSRELIESVLLNLKQKVSMILVTHNIEQAKKLSDYVNIMAYGLDGGYLIDSNNIIKTESINNGIYHTFV